MDLSEYDKEDLGKVKEEPDHAEQLELMTVWMSDESLVMFMMGVVIAKLGLFEESEQNYLLRQKITSFIPLIDNRTIQRSQFISAVLQELDKFKNHHQIKSISPQLEKQKVDKIKPSKIPSISQAEAIRRVLTCWEELKHIDSDLKIDIKDNHNQMIIPNLEKVVHEAQNNNTYIKCPFCNTNLRNVSQDDWILCKCSNKICVDCEMTEQPCNIQCFCPRQKKEKQKLVQSPKSKIIIKNRKRFI